ncbi:MAG TPA: sce7725 family protein [Bryobacteraceae bacterium]|nr:sce7725 family protein [Bryobacteraceae bacterium]
MYHPYFRGKQYELITVREMAPLLAKVDFCPIIEPVRSDLGGLRKALDAVAKANGHATVIVNPQCGDLSDSDAAVSDLLKEGLLGRPSISAGILLAPGVTADDAFSRYGAHAQHSPEFIHAGFTEAKALAEKLGRPTASQRHVFIDGLCGKLYQKRFQGTYRVLLRDGFKKQNRNADYPPVEHFSDLHATFKDEGMDGFGDFLIVGDEYNESGGPAYSVAIHLTFIDKDQDDSMQVYHFRSDGQDTPTDPAGKFSEALSSMVHTLNLPNSKVLETDAVKEFRELHDRGHFPGLGYIKKLSMDHHIQTLASYIKTVE